MPQQELSHRRQKALLWERTGTDSYGQPTISNTPTELNVRWNDVRREAVDSQGNTIAIDAEVVVDRQIAIGSVMWNGGLDDLLGTSLVPPSDIMMVKVYNDTKDIRNRVAYRTVSLMRLKDTLPTMTS